MKTLENFKKNQLSPEQCKLIKCGIDDKPKPTPQVRPGGGVDEDSSKCYYDFDGELLYCEDKDGVYISNI